jgi:hypothetical protein
MAIRNSLFRDQRRRGVFSWLRSRPQRCECLMRHDHADVLHANVTGQVIVVSFYTIPALELLKATFLSYTS